MKYQIAGKVIDQYDSPELLEELVHSKVAMDLGEMSDNALDSDFALCIQGNRLHRKFPINTMEKVAASAAFYCANRDNLPEIFRGPAAYYLKKASVEFGLKIPDQLNEDAVESSRYVDIRDAHQLSDTVTKEAAFSTISRRIHSDFPVMHPTEKVQAAQLMNKLAEDIGEEVPQYLQDYIPRDDVGYLFKEALDSRMSYLKLSGNYAPQEELKELFKVAHTAENAIKLLSAFDKSHSLDDYTRFVDPWKAAYGGISKVARPAGDTSTGPSATIEDQLEKRYKFECLTTTCRDKLNTVFNASTVDRIATDPERFYEEAPANVKRILDKIMDKAVQGVDREGYYLSEVKEDGPKVER